ncbi:MarR family transcriptional regulator [Actinoplanes sp. NPDC051346]|uniref:MarR family winged helix-turn-helix transcriptional regulator n=1 Tax=Actinoplanes sp. NPDC051346 TaxID=3155048 RepID=UPI003416A9EF
MNEIDPLTEGVVERIHLISRYLANACGRIAAPHAISARDYDILARLYWTGEPYRLAPSQLAAGTQAPATTITNRLDRLERLDLLRRVPAPTDRRSMLAELTEHGVELFRAIVVEQATLERAVFARLPADDLAQLRDLLDRTMQACQEEFGPPPRRVDLTRES